MHDAALSGIYLNAAKLNVGSEGVVYLWNAFNECKMNLKNVRIKDIAMLAGVSKGTVDRVLHKRGRVSEEAEQKVLKVLEEIDYKPNLIARTLSSNKNYRIIALLPDAAADEYWAQTREGILQAQAEWTYYNVTIELFVFDQYNKESFREKADEAALLKKKAELEKQGIHFTNRKRR